eukprot:CAMPEP_0172533224 /NCGR_PEP_ID=MMETSP1067-20121228/6006_1 /TAXON_ID=265564 ORGANISM="Thalassiosira punctigera, Strain Tpunct2005C2" /NCGR_SAMPLE_ID=MMETSP1067 /ASSEMBLY_ACC=CAM_ASM_000444 /LENGTH=235 /DNA_ID=CAMNT_0013317841 /DNA_START=124 /DNA_END=831 /DNA_ORIENTATION=+
MGTEAARKLLTGTTPLKLEYFDIQGVAEPVRIALSVVDVPFEDVRIQFKDWPTKKSTTKHGVLPEMTLPDGTVVTESMAMLRLAGEADPEGKLYPADDAATRLKVEQALGLAGDMKRAWMPAMYMGMRPQKFGYPPKDEWDEADAVIERMRKGFVADELPKYMGFFTDLINESGGKFLCGDDLTIADILAYQEIAYFGRGIADHVPKESLEPYPDILAWMGRVDAHPKVAAYKAK